MKRIVTEKRCGKCHIIKPLTGFHRGGASGNRAAFCKPCANEASLAWRVANREYHRQEAKKWRERHPEYGSTYYAEHKEHKLENNRRWYAEHPEWSKAHPKNRRARGRDAGGVVTAEEWSALLVKYGNRCLCCGRTNVKLTMDHVIPLNPGQHVIENIQPLCLSCNASKKRKTVDYRR